MIFQYRNVNYALLDLPAVVRANGEVEETRNGPVISYPAPLILKTTHPLERVILIPERKANPFLFLLDGLSILSRVNLVKPFADITPRFMDYSDDGATLRGHYGKRLYRQIPKAIEHLKENPNNRRISLDIWNDELDLGTNSKDIPCNQQVNLRIIRGALDMVVFNRSNDIMWGLLGANIVQFSFLQEYLSAKIGVPMGTLYQVSTNAHIYTQFGPGKYPVNWNEAPREYPPVHPLNTTDLTHELDMLFMDLSSRDIQLPVRSDNEFMQRIVLPMMQAWRTKDPGWIQGEWDWHVAGREYLAR